MRRRIAARAALIAGFVLVFIGCTAPARPATSTAAPIPPTRSTSEATRPARVSGTPASGAQDWPTFDHDPQRTGVNAAETAITPATVAGLQQVWSQALPELTGSAPILLSNIAMPDGTTRNLLFLTTSHGTTLALDAASGAILWQQSTTGPQIGNQPCQVCATPVADPSRQWIYASGNDGAIHRYAVATGAEDTSAPWPLPVTLMNGYEKRSSALNLANGMLYVALSGYNGDFGPYVGHLVTVNLATGASTVFNVLCSDQHQLLASPTVVPNPPATCSQREAGVWARSGVVVDQGDGPTSGSIFLASGNGPFDANQGGVNYGDSVVRLSGDGSTVLDSWTPADYQQLDDSDTDLGSTDPVLLPAQANSSTPYLAVQGGKDGIARLLDRTRLGGVGGELQALDLGAGRILAAPVAWMDASGATWVFVGSDGGLTALRLNVDASGKATLSQQWQMPGFSSSPIVAGGVLFAATRTAIVARDPQTGQMLWSANLPSAGGQFQAIHWQSPIVANGCLYIADQAAHLNAFCLPNP
jgi:outer membrane protein assembly factor BamB